MKWRLPRGGLKIYVARTAYALALLVLMCTAWLVLTGTQLVRDVGDLARFGMVLFQILAPLQLALAAFFSALLAASEVAHEKDRRTLILLLLTSLSNSELVLGKLLASLLSVLVMLAAALPVFLLTALLGGVSYGQIARAFAVTLATVLVCGSLGSMLALWREKTFQALAMTVLVLVLWLAVGEIVAARRAGRELRRAVVPGAGRRVQPLAGHSGSHPPLRPRPAGPRPVGHAGPSVPGGGRGDRAVAERRGRGHGAGVESVAGSDGEGREGEGERRARVQRERATRGVGRRQVERQRTWHGDSRLPLPIAQSPPLSLLSPLFPLLSRPLAASGTTR